METRRGIRTMVEDSRFVTALYLEDSKQPAYVAGGDYADAIIPYFEGDNLWFAIIGGTEILERVNGAYVKSVCHIEG